MRDNLREIIYGKVDSERNRQDEKFGEQDHIPTMWISILGEEFGEMCKANIEGKMLEYEKELIQVIAVGVHMLECFYKQSGWDLERI